MTASPKAPGRARSLHPRARRRALASAACVAALVALLALTAAPALAKPTHLFSFSFGTGELSLTAGSGLAFNQSSGDLYVADTGHGQIAEFEADGTPVRTFGSLGAPSFLTVDPATGDLYAVDSASDSISKFEADGTPVASWGTLGKLEGFGAIAGIAVGSSGDLFVLEESSETHRLSPAGAEISTFQAPRGTSPRGLAADTEGNLYKIDGSPEVTKFSNTGELLSNTLDQRGDAANLAIDPSNDDLYVPQEGEGGVPPFVNRFGVNCGELCTPLESFGSGEVSSPGGIAIDAADHAVYLIDVADSRLDVFAAATLPDVTTQPAVVHSTTSATLEGEVNPAGEPLTECFFEWGETTAYGQTAACEPNAAALGEGTTFVPVHTDLAGLTPGTAYHYRLVAANANGTNSESTDQHFFTGASTDSTSVSQVTATSATLEAELNPHGLPTTYHFEYDTVPYTEGEAPHGASTPSGEAGEGESDVTRVVGVQGLQPGTVYHFRVLAENELGTVQGPDRTFTTQGTSGPALPDGRGWELVSPPDKNGIPLEPINGNGSVIQAAADGSGLTYIARGPIDSAPPANRALANSQLLARRGASGWSTEDIATPHFAPAGLASVSEYKLFSTDLSAAALEPDGATPLSPETTERTPYLRRPGGEYSPLLTAANVPEGVKFGGTEEAPEEFVGGVRFVTATPDLSHIVLESPSVLTSPSFYGGGNLSLYEWSAGTLALTSQIPVSPATACGGAGPDCAPAAAEGLNSQVGFEARGMRHAISADGSRVVFEAGNVLYLRDAARGETLQLDAAQGGPGSGGARFQDASVDGSRVFFTDGRQLTADSTAGPGTPDLYMCEVGEAAGHLACALTDLTVDHNLGESADVRGGVLGASSDGSTVYFVANGALAPGAVHGDCQGGANPADQPPAASCNLYRYDTATETTTLVAVLAARDGNDWLEGLGSDLPRLSARLSPDGRWLTFMSQRPLTGYDNRDAASGQPAEEVFLYDAQAEGGQGRLICASCNPTGARPAGFLEGSRPPFPLVDRGTHWQGQTLAASIPGWTPVSEFHALYQSRYLSDSGRLFFNANDALVPQDSNGTEDVYQYEPAGVGGCTESSPTYGQKSGGCVDLISSGTSGEESAFLDASESGNDVFFLTASQLSRRDVDRALDVYDARVGGGEAEPLAPVECDGDACQPPATPPGHPTPGTSTLNGPGNVVECPKGKVKKHGRCLARKHKRSHKKHKKGKRTASHNRGGQK